MRFDTGILLGIIVVGSIAIAFVQTERLGAVERMLTEVRLERDQLSRSVTEMAAERAAAELRARIAAAAQIDIVTAPPEADGPVSAVLRRALVAADEIGGVQ